MPIFYPPGYNSVHDATAAGVTDAWTLVHTTSGVALAGIGTGALFRAQDASGQIEDAARIAAVLTNVGAGTEASALAVQVRSAGGALAEAWRMTASALLPFASGSQNIGDITHVVGDVFTSRIGPTVGTNTYFYFGSPSQFVIAGAGNLTLSTTAIYPNAPLQQGLGTSAIRWGTSYLSLVNALVDDATNNGVTYVGTWTHTTSGSPASGLGVGHLFQAENSTPATVDVAAIEAIVTTVTATAEESALIVKTRTGGAALAERFRVTSTGIQSSGGARVPRTTVADQAYQALVTDAIIAYTALTAQRTVTLPAAAAAGAGFLLIVHDEAAGATANNIVVDGSGAETVDGAASVSIILNRGTLRLYCDGAAWHTW